MAFKMFLGFAVLATCFAYDERYSESEEERTFGKQKIQRGWLARCKDGSLNYTGSESEEDEIQGKKILGGEEELVRWNINDHFHGPLHEPFTCVYDFEDGIRNGQTLIILNHIISRRNGKRFRIELDTYELPSKDSTTNFRPLLIKDDESSRIDEEGHYRPHPFIGKFMHHRFHIMESDIVGGDYFALEIRRGVSHHTRYISPPLFKISVEDMMKMPVTHH